MLDPQQEYLRLLERVRRERADLDDMEDRIRHALGDRYRNDGMVEKAVKWLLAVLVERPLDRLVDKILDRLARWRRRRSLKVSRP